MMSSHPPLVPQGDKPLVVVIGRISTEHQRQESIEASFEYVRTFLERLYDGPMDVRYFGEQASGMIRDRQTMLEVEELIGEGIVDLVLAEDLSRIYRNPRLQYVFVQDVVDAGARVICIADNLDTAHDDWEGLMCFATVRHGLTVPDTRRRVKRTAVDGFARGGMVMKCKFSYRKLSPEEAASGDYGPKGLRIARVSEATPIIRQMRERCVALQPLRATAEWLNDQGISPGPYVAKRQWTAALVRNLLRDPILVGRRTFGKTVGKRLYKTGKSKRRRNDQPLEAHYAELAHMTQEEFDELQVALDMLGERQRRRENQKHPLLDVPKSRVPWPQQHLTCAICGGLFYKFGRDQLKCCNAQGQGDRHCWNHVQVPCDLTRTKTIAWLLDVLQERADVRTVIVDAAWTKIQRLGSQQSRKLKSVDAEIRQLEKQATRFADAIAEGGDIPTLVARVAETDQALAAARKRREKIAAELSTDRLPLTREDVAAQLDSALPAIAQRSFEFGTLLRRLFPRFEIVPVQALDTAQVRPRARMTLRIADLPREADNEDACETEIEAELDLFRPPLHIQMLQTVTQARDSSPSSSLRTLAATLGLNYMTVKRALAYAQQMETVGTTDPYRPLTEAPENASRWRKKRRPPPAPEMMIDEFAERGGNASQAK